MDGSSLDRTRILELFDELSRELRFRGTRAQIYMVGSAAMSLAFTGNERRGTWMRGSTRGTTG